ncbi:hypothetical protein PG996_013790 [Apiospora saccharicola]|uniref:Uncharacterized protein n=1 Tax=Apiospora saccharicola TaxID=335842 RepID=A0ABR1TID9_9PEZI
MGTSGKHTAEPAVGTLSIARKNCLFKQLKGNRWTCCRCGHNANKEGWCVGKINHPFGGWTPRGLEPQSWQTCGHGYCSKCSRDLSSSRAGTPTEQVREQRKGKSSRKHAFPHPRSSHSHSHKRGTAGGGDYFVEEYVPSPVAGSSRISNAPPLEPGNDASQRKSKSSTEKKKQRRTHH